MFGALGNIGNLIKQARSLQENMAKVQEQLAAQRHEADAGAGMVRATVNGKAELLSVRIEPSAAGDLESLEYLIVAAVNAASRKAQEAMKQEMAKLTGGMNLPGLQEMLGSMPQ